MKPFSECANCGAVIAVEELDEIKSYSTRVEPSDENPAGQCPRCGALAYLVGLASLERVFG